MSNQPTFAELAQKYNTQITAYNSFENSFIQRVLLVEQGADGHDVFTWKKQAISEIETDINSFTHYLQLFSDLYKQIFILASHSDPDGNRKQYLEGITVVINSIQYIYLTRLSQNLNDRNNVKNFQWAIFSIILGIVSTVISMAGPYYLPDETGDKVDLLLEKIKKLEAGPGTGKKNEIASGNSAPIVPTAKIDTKKTD